MKKDDKVYLRHVLDAIAQVLPSLKHNVERILDEMEKEDLDES